MSLKKARAFTLSELLIALAILGVIAAFAIPKVLQAQTDTKNTAIVKEAVGTISGAFQAYKLQNTVASGTRASHLTPYMNYVKVDTTSLFDQVHGGTSTVDCSNASFVCLKLHNGAILQMMSGNNFGGTATTNAVWFYVDPDGKVTDGTANGPGHPVVLFLYTTGRIATYGTIDAGTSDNTGPYIPSPALDPPWFSWN